MGDRTEVTITIRGEDSKKISDDELSKIGADEVDEYTVDGIEIFSLTGYEINHGTWKEAEELLLEKRIPYDLSWGMGSNYAPEKSRSVSIKTARPLSKPSAMRIVSSLTPRRLNWPVQLMAI